MADKNKKSIYLTDKMMEIYEDKERKRSFSGRIADIVDRYDILINLADKPALTDTQKEILSKVVSDKFVDKLKIKYLGDEIRDTNIDGAEELADIVDNISVLDRMALIEEVK